MIERSKINKDSYELAIGYSYFITIRLADSIPVRIVRQLKDDYQYRVSFIERELPQEKDLLIALERKKYFAKYDHQLDQYIEPNSILYHEDAIECLKNALHEKDNVWYHLHTYSILPNHVHILLDNLMEIDGVHHAKPISEILTYLKKKSSYDIQRTMAVNRTIWQKENYTHSISTENEWLNIASYVSTNPVKADLVRSWRDWKHTYVKE
ncbi:MAG: putative transposase [Maribacter sp.]|jgi:putative transposase